MNPDLDLDPSSQPEDQGIGDPGDFILAQRKRAMANALTSLDDSPEDAARAQELSEATGASPALVYGNLKNFEQQHKAALTAHLLKNNQFLAEYADSHPLAAKVSSNDWGQLDTVSNLVQKLHQGPLGAPSTTMAAAVKGFSEGYGGEPGFGQWLPTDPSINRLAWSEMTAIGYPLEFAGRVFSGLMEGLRQGSTQAQIAFGSDANQAEQRANELVGMVEAQMMTMTGYHPPEVIEPLVRKVGQAGQAVKPYLDAGVEPPVGVHEVIDQLHSEQAKQDVKQLDEIFKESQASATRERAPELFADFIRQHTDSRIGIDAEAVRKLYGDKLPETDDNLLGWVPGIQDQLALAEAHGGDVEVPLADWLAKADPEVAKELHDFIRVRPGGMTLEETKEAGKPVEIGEDAVPAMMPIEGAGIKGADLDEMREANENKKLQAPTYEGALKDQVKQKYRGISAENADIRTYAEWKQVAEAEAPAHNTSAPNKPNAYAAARNYSRGSDKPTILIGSEGRRQVFMDGNKVYREPRNKELDALRMEAIRKSAGLEPIFAAGGAREGKAEPGIIPVNAAPYEGEPKEVKGGTQLSPYLNFPLKDGLKQINSDYLTGIPAVLHEFYKDRLSKLAGDVTIHVATDADMFRVSHELFGGQKGEYSPAFYNPNTDEIYISDKYATGKYGHDAAAFMLMHEGGHALSVIAMQEHPELRTQVVAMMNEVKQYLKTEEPDLLKEGEHAYAFKNEKEFWAQAWSATGFQHTLSMIPMSEELAARIGMKSAGGKSIYDAFRRIIRMMMQKLFPGVDIPPTIVDGLFHLQSKFEQIEAKERGKKLGINEVEGAPPVKPEDTERDLFTKASAIGMTKDQYSRYQDLIAKRAAEDAEHQAKLGERIERERQTKEWKDNYSRVRDEVRADLRSRPDFAADRLLREGDLHGQKVQRPRLRTMDIPREFDGRIPEAYLSRDGVSPDTLAGLFGYQSGDALVGALARLEQERELEGLTPAAHFSKVVDAETERQMRKQYGNLEENILAEAKDHVISQTQMDLLHEEMVALAAQGGGQLPFSKEDLKRWTKEQFDRTPLGSHSTDKYLAASGRAANKVQDALAEGNPTEALKFKQQQQISLLLANEAKKLDKEKDRFDRLTKRIAKREIPSVPPEWANFIHQQLLKGGVMVRRSLQDINEQIARHPWPDFLSFSKDKSDKYGYPIEFDDNVYDPAWRKEQDNMTPDEWRGWSGAVRTLYNYAQDANKVLKSGAKEDLAEWREKAVEQLKDQGIKTVRENKSKIGQLPEMAKSQLYRLVWMESVFNRWDLGNKRGLFKTTLSYDASEKVNQYSSWVKELSRQLGTLDEHKTDMKAKVDSIFTRPSSKSADNPVGDLRDMNKENVRAVIKWLGTKSGEEKLIKGWMLDAKATKQQVAEARPRLLQWLERVSDKKDWDFVEGLFRVNENIYEKYANMVTNVGGMPAKRVELNPITIHGKTYAGGYAKILYDTSEEGASRTLMGKSFDETDAMGDSNFFKANTPRSHEKERTGYSAPLYLGLDRDAGAMSNILRDAAIRPFIINASKILYDHEFRQAVKRHAGEVPRDMFDPYLKGIAGMGASMSKSAAQLDRIIEYFSRNIVSRLIGWNIHTVAKHGLSAAINSVGEVGAQNIANELYHLKDVGDLHPTLSNEEWAMSQSHELQRRVQNAIETFGGAFEKLRAGRSARDWWQEKGAAPIGYFDLMSATPTWIAEYKRQIAKMAEEGDVNSGEAQQIADYAVRRAHGSSAVSSRPEAMRGGALARTFVRLYGFFNAMLQRNYEAMWRTKYMASQFSEGEYQKGLAQLPQIGKMLLMGNLAPALIEELITPYPSGDKDSWGKWAGKMLLYASSGMIPGVREAVHAWVGGFGTNLGILDTGLKELSSVVADVHQGAKMFDAEHGGKTLKELNALFADAAGWSNDQVGRTIKTLWDSMHRSKETPKTIGETARELTSGHPRAKK